MLTLPLGADPGDSESALSARLPEFDSTPGSPPAEYMGVLIPNVALGDAAGSNIPMSMWSFYGGVFMVVKLRCLTIDTIFYCHRRRRTALRCIPLLPANLPLAPHARALEHQALSVTSCLSTVHSLREMCGRSGSRFWLTSILVLPT